MTAQTARADLRALIDRYAILGDRGDTEQLADLFVEDGVLTTGSWEAKGARAISEQLSRRGDRNADLSVLRHHVTSCDLSVEEDGTATGRSYFLVITNGGLDRSGVYVDRFRLAAGGWRFARREVRIDWISKDSLLPFQPLRPASAGGSDDRPM